MHSHVKRVSDARKVEKIGRDAFGRGGGELKYVHTRTMHTHVYTWTYERARPARWRVERPIISMHIRMHACNTNTTNKHEK